MHQICYQGTVGGFRSYALPELRRAAMRGWTIAQHKRRIQQALFHARLQASLPQSRGPRGAA